MPRSGSRASTVPLRERSSHAPRPQRQSAGNGFNARRPPVVFWTHIETLFIAKRNAADPDLSAQRSTKQQSHWKTS